MRCLVTGGAGFVGANLVRRLLKDGHEVHLLLRSNQNRWRLNGLDDLIRCYPVDLVDQALPGTVETIRPEWVFHLAAHGAYSWQTDLEQIIRTNLLGTINLVQACLKSGFDSFVNTGSSSEYGYKNHPPSELECPEPNSHYAVSKVAATLFCQHTSRREGVHIRTLRLYSVFGAYEDPNRLMPTLINRGFKGEFPPLVSPETARDYIYIDDVLDAFLLAAALKDKHQGTVYNVGTGVQTTLREVVEVTRRVLGVCAEPKWGTMPSRTWDTDCWVANNKLICQDLGWRPKHSFEEGFRQMVEFYRRNQGFG
jgi:nucleoside-diphosphate-sugar epimerase